MNTQYIKKQAIAKQLGEIMENACKYSPTTPAKYGNIEPDTNALANFILKIAHLTWLHFLDELTEAEVMEAYDFCYKVGYSVGHVLSQGTTGTWGVRLSDLDNILEILRIEDFETVGYHDTIIVLDKYEMKIDTIKINANWVWVEGEITNEFGYVEKFPVDFSWKEIYNLKKV